MQFATQYQQLGYQIRRYSEEIHGLNGNARFDRTHGTVIFVFDSRSDTDENFDLEVVLTVKILIRNACSASFNI